MDYFLLEIKVKSLCTIEYYDAVRQVHTTTNDIFEHIIHYQNTFS